MQYDHHTPVGMHKPDGSHLPSAFREFHRDQSPTIITHPILKGFLWGKWRRRASGGEEGENRQHRRHHPQEPHRPPSGPPRPPTSCGPRAYHAARSCVNVGSRGTSASQWVGRVSSTQPSRSPRSFRLAFARHFSTAASTSSQNSEEWIWPQKKHEREYNQLSEGLARPALRHRSKQASQSFLPVCLPSHIWASVRSAPQSSQARERSRSSASWQGLPVSSVRSRDSISQISQLTGHPTLLHSSYGSPIASSSGHVRSSVSWCSHGGSAAVGCGASVRSRR